eukprot:CAMPEP_0173384686 /NCGR_PEP_ID=MMETSP1356-20130122/7255_1 /TAXON_ID=77927 ORGANISM="Hemiselmis virescens, Strain PCC157" /NCGR_SAMPLE_ID=MMETSP1356 /ASSEMBLY_ACC=CAM_ASM_000847 /LENGTH=113 /DNA_ID=CAMNT_0014340159 /DNA_START=334 /DNA_END=671 /DNA_ORIENTATION=+
MKLVARMMIEFMELREDAGEDSRQQEGHTQSEPAEAAQPEGDKERQVTDSARQVTDSAASAAHPRGDAAGQGADSAASAQPGGDAAGQGTDSAQQYQNSLKISGGDDAGQSEV